MDKELLFAELKELIGNFLQDQGLDLVDLIYRYEGRDLFLKILVDKPEGGINLDECAYLNQTIGALLDEKNILQNRYMLEVSSPGLDRPLRTKNEFSRCLNKQVRVFLNTAVGGRIEWEGSVKSVDDEGVYLDIDDGIIKIELSKINKAKQIIA